MANATSPEPPTRLSLGQPVPIASHFVPTSSTHSSSSSANNANATASSSSLVNPTSLALSLPHSDHSVPLMIEMPNVLRNSARRNLKKRKRVIEEMQEAGLSVEGLTVSAGPQNEDEEVIKRLEAIGSHIGSTFVERLSRERPPFSTTLDVLKFICKELWTAIWDKQVDNLRTNHRGVYVLQDNVFKPLLRLSVPAQGVNPSSELALASRVQLAMPTGMIRGALARLGVASTVVAESSQVPQCTFHVKTTTQRS
ncbi:uncharacterized protein FA14DRAFT_4348 [Meira miltonrushii]|uniref:Transport protein particle component n=1 Tax=Meira miltonrushii TaxID=1280837 RepID=A0A316VGF4_9BASI|nr:uncharacterized protein FA14DRAFT_4348 [Meira miltonrushii]PWN36580.1 hypothetical protein FA14DRAFT_4348 [Meira miltonrushii]